MLAADTSSILQTLKANGISMNKSKIPIIQQNNKHNNAINGITLSFFISPPPFWVYYITLWSAFQCKNAFRQSEKLPKLFIIH